MWTDLGHREVLNSELTSGRFQGEVHAGREDTVDVEIVTVACGSWVVARQFSGWSPASSWVGRPFLCHETYLVRASSDIVAGCAKARVEPSVPRHVGLLFQSIRPEASEHRASRNLSRQTSGAMPRDASVGS